MSHERQRVGVLIVLGMMTLAFLGSAAYVLLGNPFEPSAISLPPLTVGEAPRAVRLTVGETGLTAISAADLHRTNLPFTAFSADGLSLTRDGQPVPFYVDGEGDEARLYFYAEAITGTLDAPAVYWLAAGEGEAMAQRNARPTGRKSALGWQRKRWEENRVFKGETTGADPWLGQVLYAPGTLQFPLTNIQPSGGPGRLLLRVWSGNDAVGYPDHHLEIQVNNESLMSYRWDGITEVTIPVPLPPGLLELGDNTLHLTLPGDTGAAGDNIYIDWIELEYESLLDLAQGQLQFVSRAPSIEIANGDEETLIFDVTDPEAPVLLINASFDEETGSLTFAGDGEQRSYVVTRPLQAYQPAISVSPDWETPLVDPGWGADYLVIVAPYAGFEEELAPLLAAREEDGLRVAVVNVEQIYDEFAFGRSTPAAIRAFIRHASEAWQSPPPRFVLLVGDASYFVRNRAANEPASLLPTQLVFTEAGGHIASDSWYTLQPNGAPIAGLAIGRMPVQNREQLQAIVEKTLAFEAAQEEVWRRRALLVAAGEGRFDSASVQLAEWLTESGFATQQLSVSEGEAIREALIGAINQGVGLVNYAGSGTLDAWGAEPILQNSDAQLLMNSDRVPVYTTFSSLNGLFCHPEEASLAETLLWTRGGGIVAAVAPSGRTFSWQQSPMGEAFYRVLLSGEATTLGEVLLQAELEVAREARLRDVIHPYNLLGDPALKITLPQR